MSDSEPPEPEPPEPAGRGADARLFTPQFLRLLLVQLSFGFSFSIFFLLPKYLTLELSVGPELIGRVTATAGVAGVLSVPLVGAWIDRGARRGLIAGGAALTALSAIGFAFIDRVDVSMFVLRAVQGIAFIVVFNAAATLAADQAPKQRLGQTIGIFGIAAVSMNAVAPSIAEPLADRYGWHLAFGLAAVAASVAAILALGLRERRPKRSRARAGAWRSLVARRPLAIFYVIGMAGAAFGTLFTFVPPFALKLGVERVSGFFVAYTIAVVSVRVGLGSLADRWGRQKIALLALMLYALVTAAAASLTPALLVVIGALFGVAHGLFYPALNAFAIEGVREEQRGSVMTFFNGSFNAGFATSALFLGTIAQDLGFPAVFLMMGGMTASAIVTLALVPDAVEPVAEGVAAPGDAGRAEQPTPVSSSSGHGVRR